MSRRPTRQNEVLTLLSKYGVMSSRVLVQLLSDQISMSWLRGLLSNLERKNLIVKASCSIGGSPTHYWMLPDTDSSRSRTALRSGVHTSLFRHKRTRFSHYPHENICTLFQASLERQMPSLKIFRESTNNFDRLPEHLLSERVRENGYTPDICIGIPVHGSENTSSKISFRWIAVEIDRSWRSKKRISQRVNIYARHTAFAGLLYLVPNERDIENLREIYATRGGKESLRILGTRNAFLATAVVPHTLIDISKMKVWCGPHEIFLSTWIAMFAAGESQERDRLLLRISNTATEMKFAETKFVTK